MWYRIFLFVFTMGLMSSNAQDPHFTQFYANPIYLNPAFAGSKRCPRLCMNYRNQWPNLSGTYVTYCLSYDQHIEAINGGLGLFVMQDNQARGTLKTTAINLIYAYKLDIKKRLILSFALQAGYLQKAIDKTKLNFGDMIDFRRGFVWNTNEVLPQVQKSVLDFSAGVLAYSKRYYFGAAIHHLNQPDEGLISSSKLPFKITAHAGANYPLEKGGSTKISPNILFMQQQNFTQLNIGLYVVKDALTGGIWYRGNDAFIITLGLQSTFIKVGYSYDVTISKLATNTAGSHEVSLQFQTTCKQKKPKYRTDSCPIF